MIIITSNNNTTKGKTMNKERTVMVADLSGQKTIAAVQLATFTHYIQNIAFGFSVTKLPNGEITLTHRKSGRRVAVISINQLAASVCYKTAGKLALARVIERAGEARVRSVLNAAESV